MAAVEVWTFSRRSYGYNCLITVGWAETGERDPGDIIDHVPSMHPTSVVCILARVCILRLSNANKIVHNYTGGRMLFGPRGAATCRGRRSAS